MGVKPRAQKFLIILVALLLVVPAGILGINQLTGGTQPSEQQAEDPRPRVDPDDQPQPTHTDKPAELAGMHEQTPEGAQATLEYMLMSYPYMMGTGDTSVWEPYSAESCMVCQAFLTNARDLKSMGGWMVGGEFSFGTSSFQGDGEPPATGMVSLQFSQEASQVIDDPERQATPVDPLEGQINAIMTWNAEAEAWVVEDMQLAGPEGQPLDENGQPIDPEQTGPSDAGTGG